MFVDEIGNKTASDFWYFITGTVSTHTHKREREREEEEEGESLITIQ
jgi:hypothetical protein